MQIGVDSFAAGNFDDGSAVRAGATSASESLRNLVDEIELADQAGLTRSGLESITGANTSIPHRR